MLPETLAEVLMNWIGASAVLAYLTFVVTRSVRSGMENRLAVLLACGAIFMVARGFMWLTGEPAARIVAMFSVGLFPLLLILFIEQLLRRHSPPFVKFTVAVATGGFSYLSLFTIFPRSAATALLVYELFVFVVIAVIIIRRDKKSLSEPENHLIESIGVASIIILPLIITDFQTVIDMPIMRVGSITILVFIFTLTRQSSASRETGAFLRGILSITLYGLVLGLVFASISVTAELFRDQSASITLSIVQPYIALGIALAFLIRILDRLVAMRRESRSRSFQNWLSTAKTTSITEFVQSVLRYAPLKNCILVSKKVLADYDITSMRPLFDEHGSLLSLENLNTISRQDQNEQLRFAAEQLIDLLGRNQCNQFCLLAEQPATALLVNIPTVAGAVRLNMELVVINKIAEALNCG